MKDVDILPGHQVAVGAADCFVRVLRRSDGGSDEKNTSAADARRHGGRGDLLREFPRRHVAPGDGESPFLPGSHRLPGETILNGPCHPTWVSGARTFLSCTMAARAGLVGQEQFVNPLRGKSRRQHHDAGTVCGKPLDCSD